MRDRPASNISEETVKRKREILDHKRGCPMVGYEALAEICECQKPKRPVRRKRGRSVRNERAESVQDVRRVC